MKFYILGPEGSGKSTIAKYLAFKAKIEILNLDEIVESRFKGNLIEKDLLKIVNLSEDNWIIEAQYILDDILNAADRIIIIKVSFLTLFFRQWKRYFTNRTYRSSHSFLQNVWLNIVTFVEQYIGIRRILAPNSAYIFTYERSREIEVNYNSKIIITKGRGDFIN